MFSRTPSKSTMSLMRVCEATDVGTMKQSVNRIGRNERIFQQIGNCRVGLK